MGGLRVGADAEDLRAGALELAPGIADPAGLGRAARGVVLGIEVEDDGLATEVGQAHRGAAVALQLEVGRRLTFLDHLTTVATLTYVRRGFRDMNPTLRGFLIIALIAVVIVVLQLQTTLAALFLLARIAFFLAIAYFVYLAWRDRREQI